MTFLADDVLLDTPATRMLYHQYAEHMPIIDYYCHVSPREIFEDRCSDNLLQA